MGEIPFDVVAPARTATGNSLIVLKGGNGFSQTMPQKVEVPNVGVEARRLHFLGGVGGWAWPCCGDNKNENVPVAKVTVFHADGQNEEILLKNGVEFADYIAPNEVAGSKAAPDLVQRGQVRWFTKELTRPGVIQKISDRSM